MNKMLPVLLVFCAMFAGAAFTQTVITLGELNVASNNWPFNYTSNSGRYQHSYSAAEMNLPSGGTVIEVRVHGTIVTPPTYNNFRLRLGHSTIAPTALGSTFDSNYTGSLHVGMGDTGTSSPVNYSPTTMPSTISARQWYAFPLTNGFQYNGTDAILLDWSYDTRTGSGWLVPTVGPRVRVFANGGNSTTLTGSTDANGNLGVQFVVQIGPQLTVTVTPGVAQQVFSNEQGPGGDGLEVGKFSITANSQGPMDLSNIEIKGDASGTGNDATAFTELRLYRDDNASDTFEFGTDVEVATAPGNFTVDAGTINFAMLPGEYNFPASTSRTYFIVAKLASLAMPNDTFNFVVFDLIATGGTTAGLPSGVMNGVFIDTPVFNCADVSPGIPQTAFLTERSVCQAFTIDYPNGPDDKPISITVKGHGTADESTDLIGVELWYDSDSSGSFAFANDTLVDTQIYAADDGILSFSFASHANFQAGQSRRYFIVYELNILASDQETFQCFVQSFPTTALGGVGGGVPCPSANGAPGLVVSAAILFVTLNGPVVPAIVSSNQAEAVLCDVTLEAAPGGSWDVIELLFNAGGTGSHNSAYSQLSLYEDTNLSGAWDPADPLAAPALGGFVANDASFFLTTQLFAPGQDRRFFVIADLNGRAATGDTFNCRLGEVDANSSIAGGSTNGLPTPAATALIIDSPAVSVSNGPHQPDPVIHVAGMAANVVAAQFRLQALGGPVTVNGFTLTTAGTGDWTTDVDANSGVQIYRDNGDGIFNAADTMHFQGGGGAAVNVTFNPPLPQLTVGQTSDLWVIIGLTASAGMGNSAAPEAFSMSLAGTTDVVATETAVFGTLPPDGITVGAIEFGVTLFNPQADFPVGGEPLVIEGSGFMTPLTVTIGGTLCGGTAIVSSTGTQVSGLTIPMGAGSNLEIIVRSGALAPQTLPLTFSYLQPKETDPPKADDPSSCAAGTGASWMALLSVLVIGAIAVRRRRA